MLAQEGHVHAGTKTVCREMSSDAECIGGLLPKTF